MSGFAGIISPDGSPPEHALLQRMAARLAFRGPDATYIVTQPDAAFCFTFLRTGPAPQTATQPLSLDGQTWLIGDVRLDARADLRLKLEQNGVSTDAHATDEELILHAYHHWQEAAFPQLLGDFSFVLWDSSARRLVALRDIIGSRPFFYAVADGRFYFSNTLEGMRCVPSFSSALDPHYIRDFLLQGWCADLARTAFRDISRLPPGHVLHYSHNTPQIQPLTWLPIEEPLYLRHAADYTSQFRALFEQAILDRLPRAPASIFMSGGLDSTSVAAITLHTARKHKLPLALRSYTLDCQPDLPDDEGRLASITARHLGIPHEIQSATWCSPYQGWDDPALPMPEPLHDPYRLLYVQATRCIANHSRVALNGYGGDGIMTGQAWPYLVDLLRHGRFVTVATAFGKFLLEHHRPPPMRGGFRQKLVRLQGRYDPMEGYPTWLQPDFERQLHLRERWLELQQPTVSSHPWYPDAHADISAGFWARVLEPEDAAYTGTPLQSRAPLLDRRILRFLLRVPPVPLCIDKELLRRTVSDLLPNEVLSRPKTPFLGDLFALHIGSGRWNWQKIPPPPSEIHNFVIWNTSVASLNRSTGLQRWTDLRPVTLAYWLRRIENTHQIQ